MPVALPPAGMTDKLGWMDRLREEASVRVQK